MKRKMLVILAGVVFLHVILLAGICISGGCSTNKVLKPRTYQPAQPVAPVIPPVDVTNAPDSPLKEDVPPIPETKVDAIKHTVVKGDSLWKIANEYGVSTGELATYNKIDTKKGLKVGEVIEIPPGGHAGAKSTKAAAEKSLAPKAGSATAPKKEASKTGEKAEKKVGEAAPADGTYTVKEGDSLWKIAVKYNLKTETLASANNIDPKKGLKLGQKLVIPKPGATASATAPLGDKPVTDKKSADKKGADKKASDPAAGSTPSSEPAADMPLDLPAGSGTGTEDILGDIAKIQPAAPSKAAAPPAAAAPAAAPAKAAAAPAAAPAAPAPKAAGDAIDIDTDMTVEDLANLYGYKAADIKKLNPSLPADGKLKAGTKVVLP